MVRRGSRTTGPQSNNTSSSSSGSHEVQWKPLRAHSTGAETSGTKSAKSSDSADSSPGSRHSTSPPIIKKGGGKSARSSSHWRTRGTGGGRNVMVDPKFTITSEEFPALPGARGGNGGTSHSTPSKYFKKDKENGKFVNIDMTATDDSGVSSGSRGHTPTGFPEQPARISSTSIKIGKSDIENKKKPAPTPSFATADNVKRKNGSPIKERPPRGNLKHGRITVQSAVAAAPSPKKKTINANAANTAPSFMKLSKVGQKIPERRGGPRVNNNSQPSVISSSPTGDDKENSPEKRLEAPSIKLDQHHVDIPDTENAKIEIERSKLANLMNKDGSWKMLEAAPQLAQKKVSSIPASLPPSHCIFHPSDVPKIILGPEGEMSNIPPTMLTDQFGMAAMLPILDIVRNRSGNVDPSTLTSEELSQKNQNENIEMISIGFDLNELGVPMKSQEHSQKPVWETFAGPFGLQPLLPTNMGLAYNQVPSVYYTARTLQSSFDMLTNIPEKFGDHELFYIFYNLPKEIWQLNAARELYISIQFRVFYSFYSYSSDNAGVDNANPFTQPGPNQDDLMIGNFEIYDMEKARICSAELCLRRSDFEVPAWEQTSLDEYQKMVAAMVPKEMLWGPREDRKNHGLIQGITGMLPSFNGRNKISNLTIPKPQQSSERRLLSFVDSPDISSNFENPFGSLPPSTTAEDIYRQQMYALLLQKMQSHQQQQYQQQQQQQLAASVQSKLPASSSFSASNYFQN
ncbi:hypothetical protein CAEBREN_32635 [Caenorhabditis brenneri]|uniref:Uncharacterized protein n=1 Tax=Caenorhabditis brenneri TaxID=135651 RepID=G0NTV2_CAEBE|nr:hypothetical protein CAEBREN_32635 [Caenorhabditis brenneri]